MRLRITASEAFTHMVIYTLPSEADGPFFCLENQTCSTDAINLHSRGLGEMAHLIELRPGESSDGFIQYTGSDTHSSLGGEGPCPSHEVVRGERRSQAVG